MKKTFTEPEAEVVRFNAQEIVTATSRGMNICILGDCLNDGMCSGPQDVIFGG